MGLPSSVLERASELLAREDRQLDRILAELSASRAALAREQEELGQARAETEAARAEHRARLEKLMARRDSLYEVMRGDLDHAFREAHEQVAGVIRELQRGGGGSARDAARARERLLELEEASRRAEEEAGLEPGASEELPPVDWLTARPGDPVRIAGGGSGLIAALPDRRGRVAVRLGSARVLVPAERVGAPEPAEKRTAKPATRVSFDTAERETGSDEGGAGRCDLRGMRVDEALDRLVYALDRAATSRQPSLIVIHGIGSGALRDAVRRHLRESPYVARFAGMSPEEGGEGVTRAELT